MRAEAGAVPEVAKRFLGCSDNGLDRSELGAKKVFGNRFEPEHGRLRL